MDDPRARAPRGSSLSKIWSGASSYNEPPLTPLVAWATQQPKQPLDDGQAEAEALGAVAFRIADLEELLENVLV